VKTWVKLYTEINRDADMGTLTWAQRGIWSAMLALAGELDHRDDDGVETGALDAPERVAWHLRLTPDELADAVQAFTERGMLEERDGVLFLPHFTSRQGRAPSDRPAVVAQRVKRYRERQATTEPPACNERVTSAQRGVTCSDSDSETETETDAETEVSAEAAGAGAPTKAARKRPKAPSKADARTSSPAIQCVYAISGGKYPPKPMYDRLIETLGSSPDGPKLRRCYEAWIERGYNPNAWTWATEWYTTGIPPRNGSRASPDGVPRGQAAIDAWLASKEVPGGN
jgi:hypothetical protein